MSACTCPTRSGSFLTASGFHCHDCYRPIPPTVKSAPDMVNHPPHYTAGGIECIDAIQSALGDDAFVAYCRGTAIKYLWRTGRKGSAVEDLQKAAWYVNRAAATLDAALGEG